jgi:hypothetical protein
MSRKTNERARLIIGSPARETKHSKFSSRIQKIIIGFCFDRNRRGDFYYAQQEVVKQWTANRRMKKTMKKMMMTTMRR